MMYSFRFRIKEKESVNAESVNKIYIHIVKLHLLLCEGVVGRASLTVHRIPLGCGHHLPSPGNFKYSIFVTSSLIP